MVRILGIDPGYAIMGWGVVEKNGNSFKPLAYGALTTDADMAMPDRLKSLYGGLMEIIAEYEPSEMSIEQLYFNSNEKTAIFVGQARGVAILAAANNGLEIYEYTPLEIKMNISGYGRADKAQMQFMVKTMLSLKEAPKPDDAADALAAAICHGRNGDAKKKMFEMR